MKTNSSHSISARITLAALFFIVGLSLLCSLPFVSSRAQLPSNVITFSGTFDTAHAYGSGCTTFSGPFVVPAGQARIIVNVDAAVPTNDLALTLVDPLGQPIHTEDTGVGNEVFDYEGSPVPAGSYKVYVCTSANPLAPFQQPNTYNGTFTYNDTAVSTGCPANFTPTLPAAPRDAGPKIGYENFEAPGQLTTITQTSSGLYTVEYLGRSAVEPSIGANWKTGVINYKSDLEALFVTVGSNGSANWVNRRAPTSKFIDSDPIGFTDRQTGRVFVSELTPPFS